MKNKAEKAPPVYEVVAENGLFALHRNGRYLMTPKGNAFRSDKKPLLDAICSEWQSQGEKIDAATMPLTQLMATALDIVGQDRSKTTGGLLAYISSELLCHRADEGSDLAAKQQAVWQPVLDWCSKRYDVSFAVSSGVMPVRQSPELHARLQAVIESFADFNLTGLSSAVDSAGSLILGLALSEGELSATQVFEAAELDSNYQAATWGSDPVMETRHATIKYDLAACEKWFGFLKS